MKDNADVLRSDNESAIWRCKQVSPEGETLATMPFVALNRESYVILRTGVKAQQGTSSPPAAPLDRATFRGLVLGGIEAKICK